MSQLEASQHSVLELFENELSSVQFPGLDAEVLKKAREQVELLALEVEKAEAILEAARSALQLAQEQLGLRCQRALAYAKVYAEEHPEVAEKISGLMLSAPRPEAPQETPRRRRTKTREKETTLFEAEMTEVLSAA